MNLFRFTRRNLSRLWSRLVDRARLMRRESQRSRLRGRRRGWAQRLAQTQTWVATPVTILEPRVLLATVISTDRILPGQNILIADSESITIAEGVTLSTSSTTGAAGNIWLAAPQITIQNGASLLASGSTTGGDGSITLNASNATGTSGFPANPLGIFQLLGGVTLSAGITLQESVTITGGNVSLTAFAGDQMQGVQTVENVPVVGQAVDAFFSAFSMISAAPVSVSVKMPTASISTGQAQIVSSGSVTITSTAGAYATGLAAMTSLNPYFQKLMWQGSVGFSYADSWSTTEIQTGTSIQAAGEICIQSDTTNTSNMVAEVIRSTKFKVTTQFTEEQANSKLWELSSSTSVSNAVSHTYVDQGAVVTSTGSTVEITATAKELQEVTAQSISYLTGQVGFALGLLFADADVLAQVDGVITAGQATVPEPVIFNPDFTVDFSSNSLVFASPSQYSTGDPVVYDAGVGGQPIPGLTDGTTYYVIVNSTSPNIVQLAATAADAANGVAVSLGSAYPTLTTANGVLPIIMVNTATSNTLAFGYSQWPDGTPLFTNGETVTYAPAPGQFLGQNDALGNFLGALPAGSYTVQIVNSVISATTPFTIQLLDAQGNVVDLNQQAYFTDASNNVYQVFQFLPNSESVNFSFPTQGTGPGQVSWPTPDQSSLIANLSNGTSLTYHQALGTIVSGLTDGTTYYAVVDPANPGLIQLAQSALQAAAANPVIQNAIPTLTNASGQTLSSTLLLVGSVTDSLSGGNSTLQNPTQTLWNNATGGTFTLSLATGGASFTTADLPWNIAAADLEAAISAAAGVSCLVTGSGTQATPWSITLPAGTSALLVTAATDSLIGGSSTLTNSLTQAIFNDASGGTFVLNLQINGGLVPTSALAQDSSAADIAAAILEATGVTVTVTGCGEAGDPWLVTPTYSAVVSDFQWGTILVFDTAPGIADGTPVIYNAAPDKPILGLSDGATYFLYSQINPAFNPDDPQYVMGLRATQDAQAPLVNWYFQQSLTDAEGNDYVITAIDRGNDILTVALTDPAPITTTNDAGLVGGALSLTTVEAGTWSLFNNASGGTFLLSIPTSNGSTATTSPLAYNASGGDVQAALNGLPGISNVSVTGLGTLASPWLIAGTGLSGLASDDSGLTAGTMEAGSLVTKGYQVSTNATGGTFTLSFSAAGGLQQTTTPLAWNSSAGDIQQAIGNLLGAGATVTGSGTANNPWNIDSGSAEMTIDGSQLTSGGSVATTSSEVGIQLWTNADGGTFCLSLTPTGSGSQTTSPLSATATATQIQSALAALGYTATVTGEGTSTCPWSIAGPGLDGLTVSNSQLTQTLGGGTYFNSTLVDQTLLSTTATGGTFVLGITVDGTEQFTAPLAWNSTADQVQSALDSLPGVAAWVSGSGSPMDPWVIQAFASTVQAGSALVFNDGWGVSSLGLLEGTTYYAVPLPNQSTAGTFMLQLTASQSEAIAATPTPLPLGTTLWLGEISTGAMFGSNMTLSSPTSATGITVQATLTAANSSEVYTQLGGTPLLEQRISQLPLLGGNFSISNWFHHDPKLNEWMTAYEQNVLYSQGDGRPFNIGASASGKKINHQVLAVVGNTAQLVTAGSVLVQATVVNELSGSVESFLSSPGFGGTGVDVAANITVVNNTVQAIIESNASVTGGAGVSVDASVEYPYQFSWILDDDAEKSGQNPWEYLFGTDTIGTLNSLGNGNLGINTLFANNWTDAAVNPSYVNPGFQGSGSAYNSALSTSIQVVNVTTTTIAQIAAGAQINTLNDQLPSTPTEQPVSVTADTDLTQFSFAGLMELNWGPDLALKWLTHGHGHAATSLPAGAKSAGGSVAYYGFDTSTQAVIGGNNLLAGAVSTPSPLSPTVINYGNGNSDSENHGLLVNAQTSLNGIQLGMSGEASTSLGFSGVASVFDVDSQETFAGIVPLVGSNLTVASLPNTSGDIEINAYDSIVLVNVAGSALTGSGDGAGVSTAINIVDNRSVTAQLGVAPGQSSPFAEILSAGDVTLSAYAGGTLLAIALGADIDSTSTPPKPAQQANQNAGDENAANQPKSGFGIAISGDFAMNLVEANVNAIVNGINTLEAEGIDNALTISASDGTTLVDLAGGFAIQSNNTEGSVGLQGSVAVNYVTTNVAAEILDTGDFSGFSPSLSATTHLTVIALAAGGSGPGTAAGEEMSKASLSVAGSIAYNYVVLNPTVAVTNSTGKNLGSIAMTAVDNSYLLAIAGTLNLPGLSIANDAAPGSFRVGIGLAGALNDVTVNPQVEVTGANLSQTSGSITLSADQNLAAMAFAAGGGSVQGGTALGGQFTDTHLNSNVEVKVSGNSTITSSSPATDAGLVLQATLSPLLISVAGNVLINTTLSGSSPLTVGAAVANTVINTSTNAQIDDSQITITNGEVQVLAGAGSPPPENVDLTNQLGTINLPHFTGNSVYSFAVGAAATNSNATGEFSVVNNNIEQWDVCAQVTGGSTITAGGNLQVTAADDATIVAVAGAFSIALTTPGSSIQGTVGAAVTTNNFNGNVEAQILNSDVSLTGSASSIDVSASSTRLIGTAAAGGNGAGMITAGVAVTVNNIQSEVTALVGNPGGTTTPTIVAPGGVTIQANDTSTIGAGAGQVNITWSGIQSSGIGNLSAGAAAAANSISMNVEAVLNNAQVTANTGDVSVEATANANITSYAVGVSGTFTAATEPKLATLSGAGSGTGNWSNSLVLAEVANSTVVANSLEVSASDSSTLESNAGSLDIQATKVTDPVSVSAGVSVAANYLGNAATPNTVTAEVIDSTVTLTGENSQGQALSIDASSTVNSTTASAAGAGSFNTGGSFFDGTGVGSLSDNNIYESVLAQLSGGTTTLTGAGNVEIQAANQTTSSAGSGGLAFAGASPNGQASYVAVSVGVALSSNIVTLSTEAMITDTATLTFPTANPGDLSLSACNQAKLFGVAVGVAGVFTGSNTDKTWVDAGGAGSSNFNTLNTTVLASICDQSTVTGPASANISASDASSAISGTGALALDIALQSYVDLSVGASIAENNSYGSVTASIDSATLTTPGEVSIEAKLVPGPEHGNAFAVAVAGSGAFAGSGSQKFNLSGAGAGAGTFNTVEFAVAAEVTDNAQVTAGSLALTATDQSQVYSNAGGVGLAAAFSSQSAAAIAVGAGVGHNNVTNTVSATIENSTVVTTGELSLNATSEPSIESIAFGVALGVAAGKTSASGAGSGAAGYNTVGNTTQANISQSTVSGGSSSGDPSGPSSLSVSATDNASIDARAGSGSLAASAGQGVALAAGAVIAQSNVSNTTQAWLGTLNPAAGTTPAATTINVAGPVSVTVNTTPDVTAEAVAVAASAEFGKGAALAGAGANAEITFAPQSGSGATVLAGILDGTTLTSTMPSGSGTPQTGVSVSANYAPNVSSTIGSGAIEGSAVGASIGVSLGTITDTTGVESLISGAMVTTNGTAIEVSTDSSSNLSVLAVATSAAISPYGAAGAGANATIVDDATYQAQIDSNNTLTCGPLSVVACSADTISSEVAGGSLGVGSIGVFLGNATRGGSTLAQLEQPTSLQVSSLNISATTNQSVETCGFSVTIGVVTGSGVQLNSYVSEVVTAELSAATDASAISVPGSVSITATSQNTVSSLNGMNVPDFNIGLLAGAGAYLSTSGADPIVTASLNGVNLSANGGLQLKASATSGTTAQTESGSGALISGAASQATTNHNPVVTANVTGGAVNSQSGLIQITSSNQSGISGFSDASNASALGGSGSILVNNGLATVTAEVGDGTTITSGLGVQILASNNYYGSSVAVGGAGGVLNGNAVEIDTGFEADVNTTIGSNVQITGNGAAGVQLATVTNANLNESAQLTTGGLVEITNTQANQSLTFNPSIIVGTSSILNAPEGNLGIGMVSNVAGTNTASCSTYGLAGGNATAITQLNLSVNPSICVNELAKLSGATIDISTSTSPLIPANSLLTGNSASYTEDEGLIAVVHTVSNLTMSSNSQIDLKWGSSVIAQQDVTLSASPLPTAPTSSTYSLDYWVTTTSAGVQDIDLEGTITIDGTVEAGSVDILDIVIPEDATPWEFTVNGQSVIAGWNQGLQGSGTPVTAGFGANPQFLTFNAAYDPFFNAQSLLTGLSPTTLGLLSPTISSSPVGTLQLSGLQASGGQVVIDAPSLQGNGSVAANVPKVTITNNSDTYLVLDGLDLISGIGAGEIVFTGSATPGESPTFSVAPFANGVSIPAVNISLTSTDTVGTTNADYGPSLFITAPISNPTGEISLSVANGSVVQQTQLNAMGVDISVPNGAYTVSSSPYVGVGGNIADAWAATASGNATYTSGNSQDSQTAQTIPVLSSFFLPGLVSTSSGVIFNPNLAVTTAVDAKFNANGTYTTAYDLVSQAVVGPVNSSTATSYVYFGDAMPYIWGSGNDDSLSYASGQTAIGSTAISPNSLITGTAAYLLGSGGKDYNMGYLPLIMPNLPLKAQGNSIPSTVTDALNGGITAAAVSITADIIDLNAQLNVGRQGNLNLTLGAHLGQLLQAYQASYQANPTGVSPLYSIPESELTGNVAATFNCTTGEITVAPVLLGTANVEVVLTGQIMSSLPDSAINLLGGPGNSTINNYTGFPVVLSGIHAGADSVEGTVIINDTLRQQTDIYKYSPGGEIQVYTGLLNQVTATGTPSSTVSGTTTSYSPAQNLVYQWTNQATLARPGNDPTDSSNWTDPPETNPTDFNYSGAWSFTSGTSGNPYQIQSTNLLIPSQRQSYLFQESVSQSIVEQYTQAITYNGHYNFSNPFTQSYIFPHNITLTATSSVIADNPVTINFGQLTNGKVQISSNANVTLQGPVVVPGNLTMDVLGSLLQGSPSVVITASSFDATATLGSLGTALQPLNVALVANGAVSASASQGVFLTSPGNLVVDQVTTQTAATATLPGQSLSGFGGNGSGWTSATNNAWHSTISNNVMTLTESGTNNTANAWWYGDKLSVLQPFAVSFTYTGQASGADGVALVLQNSTSGTTALGGIGGGVGYSGISDSLALILDIYAEDGVDGSGFGLGINGTIPTLTNASPVELDSGHPIAVLLQYDPLAATVTISLTDTVTEVTVNQSYPGIDLAIQLGASAAYLGFTGADGGVTSTQTITDFDYVSSQVVTPAQLPLNGFNQNGTGWSLAAGGGFHAAIANDVLTLTQEGTGNTANAAWFGTPVAVNQPFALTFTYTGQANGADGVAFVLQNDPRSTTAVDSIGGGLGYTGIQNSLAIALDIYGADGAEGTGLQIATDGTLGSYASTLPVALNSGHPMQVGLVYNPQTQVLDVTLIDTISGAVYSTQQLDVNLSTIVGGNTAYLGFTGSDGGVNSTQTISSFQFQPLVSASFSGSSGSWNGVTSGSGAVPVLSGGNSVWLTSTNNLNTATALWYGTPVPVASPFEVNFVYTGQGSGDEGIALVLQNDPSGINALGSAGSGLGYTGIQNSAALLLDIGASHGTAWVTGGMTGSYVSTGSVNLQSGDPIAVTLSFNPSQNVMVQTLTDTVTGATFTKSYPQYNLPDILVGNTAWIGFTGGTGSSGSNQQISDFSIVVLPSPAPISLSAGASILAASGSSLVQGNTLEFVAGLNSTSGTIGAVATPLPIEIIPQVFLGSQNAGSVSATAPQDIGLAAGTGNIVVDSIVSQQGTVSLQATAGGIVSASGLTSLNIPMNVLTGSQLQQMTDEISQSVNESTTATVNSFENTINQLYSQYWNIQQNAPLTANNLVVNGSGLTGGTVSLQAVSTGMTPVWTTATGGTFTLTVTNLSGITATTAPLAWNSSANQIAAAINGLTDSNGNSLTSFVTVTGAGTELNRWEISGPALQIELETAGLIGGGGQVGIPTGANLQLINTATGGTFTLSFTPFGGSPQTTAPLAWNANANMIWNALGALPGVGAMTVYGQGTSANPWTISGANFSVGNVPTASANLIYQLHCAVALGLPSGTLPTAAQTSQFASQLLQNCVTMFTNATVFGPSWTHLPQFQAYNSAWQFTASIKQIAQLTYGASYGFSDLGLLEVDALTPAIPGQSAPTVTPQIVAQNVILSAAGPVGQVGESTVIIIEGLADNSLSTDLQSALGLATALGGPAQLVGTYSNGQLVTYSYGSTPAGVTPLGIQTQLDVPLFIDLAPGGTLTVQQSSEVAIVEVQGDLTVGTVNSQGEIDLTAQGGVYSQPLESNSFAYPLIQGFGSNGTGWTINSNASAGSGFVAEVTNNVLALTNSAYGDTANSAWYNTPFNFTNGFTATFTYQGSPNGADGFAFVIQNSSAGLTALGGTGGSLGYAGIGNSLAVAFDIYAGDGAGGDAIQVATNGNLGDFLFVDPVFLYSGHSIDVTVSYDAETQSLTVLLHDSYSQTSWSNTFENIDLGQILGQSTAWVGFTGADGGLTSDQSISNFALSLTMPPAVAEFSEIGPLNFGSLPTPATWMGVRNGAFTPTVVDGVLTLTQAGIGGTANAAWYSSPVSVNNPFQVSFIYQGQPFGADGVAFVLQNSPQGLQALGGVGGGVGYSGISNSLAVIFDIYAGGPSEGNGILIAQGGTVNWSLGFTQPTTLNLSSGHPMAVVIDYNPQTWVLSLTITDIVTGATANLGTQVVLESLAQGDAMFLGFTGGDGGISATQTISDFSYTTYSPSQIQGTALSVAAGSNVGTNSSPLSLEVSGEVNVYSAGSVWLAQPNDSLDFTIGEIQASDSVSLSAGGSILATEEPSQGSLGGFGGTGNGWVTNGNAQIQASVGESTESTLLVIDGTQPNESSSTWYPQPVLWQNGFSAGFIVNPIGSGTGLGLSLTLQNDPRNTAAIGGAGSQLGCDGSTPIQNSLSLQFQFNSSGLTIGLGTNGGVFNVNQKTLNSSTYNSSHALQVLITYNPNGTSASGSSETLVVTLIDSTTGATYQTYFNSSLELLQILNLETAWLGITGASANTTGSPLSIDNFFYAYGAANLIASELTITSGGSIGSTSQPLVIEAAGTATINLTATDDITLLAHNGNLNAGTIFAGGTVTLLAPDGAVVGSGASAQAQSQGPLLMAFAAAAPAGSLITANSLVIDARHSAGSSNTPLLTEVQNLQARSAEGDIVVHNTGALRINSSSRIPGLLSGGQVQVQTTEGLTVDALAQGVGPVEFHVLDRGLTQQSLTATPNARISSTSSTVGLFAPDSLQLQPGSIVSATGTGVGPQISMALTRFTQGASAALIQSQGQLVADRVSLTGGEQAAQFEVTHSGLKGNTQNPVVSIQGTPGADRLVINHRNAVAGEAFTLSDNSLAGSLAQYSHSTIEAVVLELGDYADQVTIQGLRQIQSVVVNGNAGNDQFRVEFQTGGTSRIQIDGGTGTNTLTYDGAGQPLWAKPGIVQSLTAPVEHSRVQNLVPVNVPALNGTPILTGANVDALLAGLTATQKYVQRTYLQLVQRLATASELATWVKSINVNPNDATRRLALVNALLVTEEAGRVQVQAWFRTFAGRPATTSELTTYLAVWRTLKDPLVVQQQILNSSAVTQYLQSLSNTGTADERYVEGLWRLLIDPGTRLSTTEKQALVAQRNRLGRLPFLASLQKQPAFLLSQKEGYSQIFSNQTAAVDTIWTGAPTFTSHIDMYKWILARRKV